MKFSRQQSRSRFAFPTPRDLLDRGNDPTSPVLAGSFFTTVPPGKLNSCVVVQSLSCVLCIHVLITEQFRNVLFKTELGWHTVHIKDPNNSFMHIFPTAGAFEV